VDDRDAYLQVDLGQRVAGIDHLFDLGQ
jgi:hypothetical protein